MIIFKSKLIEVNSWTIVKLPKSASDKISSRGLAMVRGTINGHLFQTALEPDGKGSHWFQADSDLLKNIKAKVGDTVELEIEQVKEWPEPKLPADLRNSLNADKKALEVWNGITPFARWEWLRWVRATKNDETRKKRIQVTNSKLKAGTRRPCCFNTRECTIPQVSNKGILLD